MFELNKMQKEIRKSVRAFAKGEFEKEQCMEMDKFCKFPESQKNKAADTGYLGVHFPEEFNGGSLGVVENALIAEELCIKDSTTGCAIMLSIMGSEFLLRYGSDSLKKRYLPELSGGKIISSEAFSEQTSDSEFLNINTVAEKTDSGWVLNGKKANVINGDSSDIFFILCKIEENQDGRDNSLAVFLVDSSRSGIIVDEKKDSLGLRMLNRVDITFNNVTIPLENHIVSIGNDKKELYLYRSEILVQIAAMATGIAKGAYERSLSYIKLREQFGKKIGEFQITRHKIAEMATQIELASLITHKAAQTIDSGKPDYAICAMAKNSATRSAVKVTDEAIQLFGGYGFTSEYEVERYYRDAKVLELLGSSKSFLKDKIADKEIGRIKKSKK
ncbi:MAG: acyl-CoA/acyl-ACP dehydrogenase [Deltaproteobacteria bacterium]|nr:acyl-CoA/acyl-ACP dehydrogenase [Deltaproteobacteria bacterium]